MDDASNRNNNEEDKIIRNKYVFNNMSRMIGRYNRVIVETLGLLGCCVTWLVNISPTFRREVTPPYSRTITRNMKAVSSFETSGRRRNNLEDLVPQ